MKTIVTREPAGPIALSDRHAPNWRRMSMSVSAGAASCAIARAGASSAAKAAMAPPLIASPENGLAARQTLRRPERLRIVIRLDGGHVGRQPHPGQFRARVDMYVWRQRRGLIERADPHEAQRQNPAVVAPDRDMAGRALMDDLRASAAGRNGNGFRLARQLFDPVGLD